MLLNSDISFALFFNKSKNFQSRENVFILQLLFSCMANFFQRHVDFFSPEGSNFSVIYNSLTMWKAAFMHPGYAFFTVYCSSLAKSQGQLGFLSLRVRLGKTVFLGLPMGGMESLIMSVQNTYFKCHWEKGKYIGFLDMPLEGIHLHMIFCNSCQSHSESQICFPLYKFNCLESLIHIEWGENLITCML